MVESIHFIVQYGRKYPLHYLINFYGTDFKLPQKPELVFGFFSLVKMPSFLTCVWTTSDIFSVSSLLTTSKLSLQHYTHLEQQSWGCSWAQLCLCTSSCSTAAAERNSNALGAQCQNTPRACLDLQHFKQVRSNRLPVTHPAGQLRVPNKLHSQRVVKSRQKQQFELLHQTIKNQMNDDSVGSIVTGIWSPQNLKCINCCFLSLILHYGYKILSSTA